MSAETNQGKPVSNDANCSVAHGSGSDVPTGSYELIDMDRLRNVLVDGGAATAPEGSPSREAYEQILRCCRYRLGQKVLMQHGDNKWKRGVVVAYMLAPPQFVIGPGDKRSPLPKNAKLWGVRAERIRPRSPIPSGGEVVAWDCPNIKAQERPTRAQ